MVEVGAGKYLSRALGGEVLSARRNPDGQRVYDRRDEVASDGGLL